MNLGNYQLILSNSSGAFTSSIVNVSFDSDGNGLPDAWELAYFGHIGVDPNADADGDGVSNYDEYLEGTNPTNAASFNPRLAINVTGGGGVMQTPSQRSYTLGQAVQLNAAPAPGNVFVGWFGVATGSNAATSILMNGHKTVDALFGVPLQTALDATNVVWSTGGDVQWFGQISTSFDGVSAAQSEPMTNNQQTWLQTSFTNLHAWQLIFQWRVSSEANHDFLTFSVDGAVISQMSGDSGWQSVVNYLYPGVHVLRWVYAKDAADTGSVGLDAAWVDQVQLTPLYAEPPGTSQVVVWGTTSLGQANIPPGLTNATAVAAGQYHCLALQQNGSVVAWGNNSFHVTNVPAGLGGVAAIAAGYSHNLALKTNGTVVAWGDNQNGQTNVPVGLTNVVAVSAGNYHSLALTAYGTVEAWGNDADGETDIPVTLSHAVAISAGGSHNLALNEDGTVMAWGLNGNGQCSVPPGLSNVVAVAAGGYHSLALKRDGTVTSWGFNSNGQTNVPVGLTNAVAIAAGDYHSLALKSDGTVVGWGRSPQGNPPAGLGNVVAVDGGSLDSIALVNDGSTSVVRQPAWETIYSGLAALLSAGGAGIGPLAYQWRLNGTNIVGATNSTLVLPNTQPAGMGSYSVVISSALGGTVTSLSAIITVTNSPPIIQVEPVNQFVLAGEGTSLGVTTTGSYPLNYQWQLNGTNVSGATSPLLTVTNVEFTDAGLYQVVVSNAFGTVTSSPPALVAVEIPLLVSTIAGLAGHSGTSDGLNNLARFNALQGITGDNSGNLFVADTVNNRIRKAMPTGTNWVVTTLAGSGIAGHADGTNNAATFDQPQALVVDNTGNLYVADSLNEIIRQIAPAGTNWVVRTIAGTAGTIGHNDGTNNAATFFRPAGITIDASGNLYVAEASYNTIRKIMPVGTNWVVTTLAGSPTSGAGNSDGTNSLARFSGPQGVAVDSATNVYVADTGNNLIRKLTQSGTNWVVTTLAGSGANAAIDDIGRNAAFSAPAAIDLGSNGVLYVADMNSHAIRKLNPSGTNWIVTTVAGSPGSYGINDGLGNSALFHSPQGVFVNGAGVVYVADTSNDTIRQGVPGLQPVLVVQPPDRMVFVGTNTTFSITASGTPPINYQWQFNGSNLAGATNSTLAINNVQPANAGIYGVIASNAYGSAESRAANLTVTSLLPLITSQPSGQVVVVGANVSLSPGVIGQPPLSYQWRFNGANLVGATNATLLLPTANPGETGLYDVMVWNPYGVVTSIPASVTIISESNLVYQTSYDFLASGQLASAPGLAGQDGYFASGPLATNSQIQSDIGHSGQALVQVAPSTASAGQQAIADLDFTPPVLLTNNPLVTLAVDFYGASSDLTATNPFTATLGAEQSSNSENVIRLTIRGGNNDSKAGTGLNISLAQYNGSNNNVAVSVMVGQGLAWDTWHQATLAVDYLTGSYVSVSVDGEMQDLAGIPLPRSFVNNQAVLPTEIDFVDQEVIANPLAGQATTDEIVWDNLSLSADTAPSFLAILAPPANQLAVFGGSAEFRVAAAGTAPLSYQWQCNGNNITGANTNVLNLVNLQLTNAGLYAIVVSNLSGSVSAAALLTVGMNVNAVRSGNKLIFNWGAPYVLQTGTNVSGPYLDVAGARSPFTNLIGTEPERFFRLRSATPNSLSAGTFGANGQFTLGGSGSPGYNYMIEVSSNLLDWLPLQTNTVPFQFVDTNTLNFPIRFYRTSVIH